MATINSLSPISLGIFSSLAIYSSVVSATEVEVIEVYAQKRAQSEQQVSIAVSHINQNQIQRFSLKDATDLGAFVSNMKISKNAAEGTPPAINIRGVGLIDYNTANTSPIAMYFDGAPVGSANNQLVNLFDVGQIDISKGPQGTLFGRNSTGGAILIRSNRPDAGSYGYATVGLATDQSKKLQLMYNTELSSDSAVRVAASSNQYDYTSYNIHPTSDEAGMKQNMFRLSYLGQWDEINWFVKGQYEHWDGLVEPVGSLGIFADPTTRTPCSTAQVSAGECFNTFGFNDGVDDFWAVNVDNNSAHKSINKGWLSELSWQPNEKDDVVWVSSFNRLDRAHGFNCDGSPAHLCEGELGLKAEIMSNEFRWQSAFAENYLTLGVFTLEERLYQDNYNDILRDLRGTPFGSNSATFFYDNEIITKSNAIFAQYDWQANDAFMLTFGLRYSDESIKYDSISHLNIVIDPANLAGAKVPFYHVKGKNDDNDLSGRFAINYQLAQTKSVYFSLANGHKSGGYNGGYLASPEQAALADYESEQLIASEIGGKFLWNDHGLKLNWALFHYNYHDQQVFMNQPAATEGAPPLQLLENVADSSIYGAEADFLYSFNDNASFTLNMGYIPHADFEEYSDPLGNTLTDHRLPFTSKWNIGGQIAYLFESDYGELSTQIGFDHQSGYYFDQNQNPVAFQPSYTLWRMSAVLKKDAWKVNLWAKNLFDKQYSNLRFDLSDFLGMLQDFKGTGRRVGIDLTYHF